MPQIKVSTMHLLLLWTSPWYRTQSPGTGKGFHFQSPFFDFKDFPDNKKKKKLIIFFKKDYPEEKKQQSQGADFKSFPRYATHGLNKWAETEDNSQGTCKWMILDTCFIYFIVYFWLCWFFVIACQLSVVAVSSLLPCTGFHCSGFSCCRAQAVGT